MLGKGVKGSKGAAMGGKGAAMGSKGAAQAPPVQQPRQRVSAGRVTGTLAAWKGKFGWVAPDQPINHPLARNRKGQLYLSQEDVEKDIEGIGQPLSFFVYADGSGLGAMHVIPAKGGKPAQKAIEKPKKAGQATEPKKLGDKKAKGAGKGVKEEKKEKGEPGKAPDKTQRTVISANPVQGTVVDWRGQVGWIKPDEEVPELDEATAKSKHKGLLYLHATDVDGETPLINAQVVYFMYTDEMGYGAEMAQVIVQGDGVKPEKPPKAEGAEDERPPKALKAKGKGKAKPKPGPLALMQKKTMLRPTMLKPNMPRKQNPKAAPKPKGPTGPDLPREKVLDLPITGEVMAWKGKYGWIKPSEPIEHPEAAKHKGEVYVSMKDLVDAEKLEKGATVQFSVFVDASGLGAEEVLTL